MAVFSLIYVTVVLLSINSDVLSYGEFDVPADCKGKGFCAAKPEGYDKELEEKMNSLLPDYLKKTYSVRAAGTVDPPRTETGSDNCTIDIISQPYTYNYEDKKNWELIVQTDQFQQNFKIVRCATKRGRENSEQHQCLQKLHLKPDQKSTCETTYASRKIYVFDRKIEQVVAKKFSVPVCCACKISNK